MSEPKVSIGMPVYNAELFVASAITAVLGQTFSDFELVISDNASNDSTYEICSYFLRRDPRIRLLRQHSNIGASANYGFVARESRAPLFKWASANDLIHPGLLAACIAVMEREPDCVLTCPRTLIFSESIDDGAEYDDDLDLRMKDPVDRFVALLTRLRLSNILNGLIRRDALERAGFMQDFANSDSLLLAELSLAGTFIEVPEVMFYRRMSPASASRLKSHEELRKYYYPTSGLHMYFSTWRRQFGYLAAIRRASLTPRQRVRAAVYAVKTGLWSGPSLMQDIREVTASVLGR